MRLIDVDPRVDTGWLDLLERHDSDVFHSPAWFRVLASTYGFEPRAVVALDEDGIPRAGTSYVELDALDGPKVSVAPFSDYCDPLADTPDTWKEISDRLVGRGLPVVARCRTNRLVVEDRAFRITDRARWHGLTLGEDPEACLAGMDPSARRAIRKAERSGLRLRDAADTRDLRTFFELHLRVRKYKYGLLAQPFPFFEAIWKEFVEPGHGRIVLATHGDEPVAGVFFLEWKDRLYYKFNASDPEALGLRPNDLIVWDAIRRGSAAGIRRIDFGLSDWDQEGLARYKRKFGAEEGTITFVRHDPADHVVPERPGPRLGDIVSLLVDPRVPDDITEAGGSLLYRYFV